MELEVYRGSKQSSIMSANHLDTKAQLDNFEDKTELEHLETDKGSSKDALDLLIPIADIEPPRLLSKPMVPMLFSCFIVYFVATTCGFDGSLMSSIYTQKDYLKFYNLDATSSTSTGLVFSMYNVGQIASAFFCPLMDLYGRKFVIIMGVYGIVISAVVTAVSRNVPTLIAGRFFLSFFTQLANTAAANYCTEIAPTRHRSRVAGFYNCLWYVGSIIAAFTAYGSERSFSGSNKAFRIPLWLQCACPGIVCIFGWLIPESPRWLVGKGRIEDARKMIAKYHCNGNINDPLVEFEVAEIAETFATVSLESTWKVLDPRPMLRKRSDRYRAMLVVIMAFYGQFSGNNVCSYYLPTMLTNVGMTSQTTNVLMNACYSITSWISSLCGAYVHEIVGRRKMFMASSFGAALCLSGLAIATARYDVTAAKLASNAALAFIYLFGITFSFAFTPMQPIYPSEVSSNVLRSRNMILLNLTSGVAQFINQFAAPEAMKNIGFWFYVFYVFWDLSEVVVIYFYFVETKGRSLEELDEIFEAPNPRKASVAPRRDNEKV